MTKRIYTYLRGGLGNQMFIYAAARAAQIRYFDGEGEILLSCRNFFRTMEPERALQYTNLLKNFRIFHSAKIVDDFRLPIEKKIVKKMCGYRFCKNQKEIYEKAVRTAPFAQKFGVVACESGYIDLAKKMPKKIYMDSFFQSENYFKEVRSVLEKEFSLAYEPSKTILRISEDMQKSESVCLAVRLGDYVNHPMHYVCTPDYYKRAVERMQQIKPNSCFYLFSDDTQTAQKSFTLPHDYIIEPTCASPNETLWLMSCCKHFIISNSSFHWWAQYLGKAADKTVIAPGKWYPQDIPCALYQDSWNIVDI